MNPDTNKLEELKRDMETMNIDDFKSALNVLNVLDKLSVTQLVRPNGKPVPPHWAIFTIDEQLIIKDYTFKIAYMNETTIVLEPVGPVPIIEATNQILNIKK